MKYQRLSNINTKRDAWVEINLDAIEKNILSLKTIVKDNVKVLAVVKADAYGHGSSMIAPTLLASGVDYLGVASIDEGIELLMGVPAGKKNKAGNFPANSVHGKVMKKLKAFDKRSQGQES